MIDRINNCDALLIRNEIEPFLKRVLTGDKKNGSRTIIGRSWIRDGEPSQTFAKRGLTPNKVMLCLRCDLKGIVHHELLPVGQTIGSQVYCGQQEWLRKAVERKQPELNNRKGVVFHHENARPHTSLMTRQKLRELVWEILFHRWHHRSSRKMAELCR